MTSEIDWVRFWWRFVTDQSQTVQPTPVQIFDFLSFVQATDAWNSNQVWPQLAGALGAMGSPLSMAYEADFGAKAVEQGIVHD